MVHFENPSTQVPKPLENPRKKKAQMKTIVRVGSPEENQIRLNKREKTEERERKNIKTDIKIFNSLYHINAGIITV